MNKFFSFLMVGLSLIAFQVIEVEAQEGRTGDPRGDVRGDDRDDSRGGDARVDTRDPRGGDARVDTRDPRGDVRGDDRDDSREELRATLKNCRQTKKRDGKLSKAMKKECKAARKLKNSQ